MLLQPVIFSDTARYKNMLNHDNNNNAKNLREYRSRFSTIVAQILAFALSTNLVREVLQISNKLTIFYIIDWTLNGVDRSILSYNFNQFWEK